MTNLTTSLSRIFVSLCGGIPPELFGYENYTMVYLKKEDNLYGSRFIYAVVRNEEEGLKALYDSGLYFKYPVFDTFKFKKYYIKMYINAEEDIIYITIDGTHND